MEDVICVASKNKTMNERDIKFHPSTFLSGTFGLFRALFFWLSSYFYMYELMKWKHHIVSTAFCDEQI